MPVYTYIDDKLFIAYSYIWWQIPHLFDLWNINKWRNEWKMDNSSILKYNFARFSE